MKFQSITVSGAGRIFVKLFHQFFQLKVFAKYPRNLYRLFFQRWDLFGEKTVCLWFQRTWIPEKCRESINNWSYCSSVGKLDKMPQNIFVKIFSHVCLITRPLLLQLNSGSLEFALYTHFAPCLGLILFKTGQLRIRKKEKMSPGGFPILHCSVHSSLSFLFLDDRSGSLQYVVSCFCTMRYTFLLTTVGKGAY